MECNPISVRMITSPEISQSEGGRQVCQFNYECSRAGQLVPRNLPGLLSFLERRARRPLEAFLGVPAGLRHSAREARVEPEESALEYNPDCSRSSEEEQVDLPACSVRTLEIATEMALPYAKLWDDEKKSN